MHSRVYTFLLIFRFSTPILLLPIHVLLSSNWKCRILHIFNLSFLDILSFIFRFLIFYFISFLFLASQSSILLPCFTLFFSFHIFTYSHIFHIFTYSHFPAFFLKRFFLVPIILHPYNSLIEISLISTSDLSYISLTSLLVFPFPSSQSLSTNSPPIRIHLVILQKFSIF